MRVLLTVAAYLGTLFVVAVAAFFLVILLAGPHGGLLPRAFEGQVLIAGWLTVLAVPPWVAWLVWRRKGARHPD
jgi:hypothetical protein